MSTRRTTAIIMFHLFWFSGTLITITLVLFSIQALSTTVLSSKLSWITDFALKNFTSLALSCNYAKAFDRVDHKLWTILKEGKTRPPDLPPEKPVCRSRSNS